jgi:hypothetical protein
MKMYRAMGLAFYLTPADSASAKLNALDRPSAALEYFEKASMPQSFAGKC